MKVKDMNATVYEYDFVFDGTQLKSESDVELTSDVAAISYAFGKMGEMEYPPANGASMTTYCTIYCHLHGLRLFVCNVNTEGEMDFTE